MGAGRTEIFKRVSEYLIEAILKIEKVVENLITFQAYLYKLVSKG